MAYTPTEWSTGDTITASAMNKIENGIAGAGSALLVNTQTVSGQLTLDKTVQEIYDAFSTGTPVYLYYMYGDPAGSSSQAYEARMELMPITMVYRYADDTYRVCATRIYGSTTIMVPAVFMFGSTSMSAYPTFYRAVNVKTASVE